MHYLHGDLWGWRSSNEVYTSSNYWQLICHRQLKFQPCCWGLVLFHWTVKSAYKARTAHKSIAWSLSQTNKIRISEMRLRPWYYFLNLPQVILTGRFDNTVLEQCFSKFSVYKNHIEGLLRQILGPHPKNSYSEIWPIDKLPVLITWQIT